MWLRANEPLAWSLALPGYLDFLGSSDGWINTHWKPDIPESPEALIFHYLRPPDEGTTNNAKQAPHTAGPPGIYHTILLLPKWCILEVRPPDLDTVLTQLKSHMMLDKIYTERHLEKGTKRFFKKWRVFITCHLSDYEISQLMKLFRHSTWYNLEHLKVSGQTRTERLDSTCIHAGRPHSP